MPGPKNALGKFSFTMTRNVRGTLLGLIALAGMAACSGTMDGVVRGDGTRVELQYEQGLHRDYFTAVVDGESFKGQGVFAAANTSIGSGLGGIAAANSYGSNVVAVMFGNEASTMHCNLNYADSTGFTSAGGIGVCEHSDGRIIDVIW